MERLQFCTKPSIYSILKNVKFRKKVGKEWFPDMSSPVGEWGGMSVFAGWGWCWLGVVLTKLVDDVVKSGDCWQSWMIWMMTWYVFTGAGCAMSWMTIFWLNGERWLRHWMVGNGVESECVCGAGWVLVRSVDCVCVWWWWWWWGGGCCWQNWIILMITWYVSLGLGVQSWMTIFW